MNVTVSPGRPLRGRVRLPADKSISHRAALLSGIGSGTSEIHGFSRAVDPASTLSCLRQLGVEWTREDTRVRVEGRGLRGLREAEAAVDCGNSGTTMRLLTGILAGQSFPSQLTGDASLRARPMERIADPLRQMGARIELTEDHAPIGVEPTERLEGITYPLPIPSAQVKSCVLLAGLYAEGATTVVETSPSRDHTERMLDLPIETVTGERSEGPSRGFEERRISVPKGTTVPARTWQVPRDFSAAAFFLVAASIVPESRLRLTDVGLNPTRTGLIDVLRRMGAEVEVENRRTVSGEPIGDLTVESGPLRGVAVDPDLIPNLIDEVPILAVAGACAEGSLEVREAEELRVKETDRIDAVVENLRRMEVDVDEYEDGFVVHGEGGLQAATLDSFGDHRMAMAMAVAALRAEGDSTIRGAEHAEISFPQFWDELDRLRAE